MNNQTNNYFGLFSLPLTFDLNKTKLDTAYRESQKVSHPDRFVNEASDIQLKAVQQTAFNTEAYQTLKSPVLRACHLLTILGNKFDLASYTVSDVDLLMQQMHYREQLADIKQSEDHDLLESFAAKVKQLTENTMGQISTLFTLNVNNNLDAIKNLICELQFLQKLAVDLDEVEDHLMLIE